MSKGDAPAAPSYQSLIDAANGQSGYYGQLVKDQLAFAQGAHDRNLPFYQGVTDADLSSMFEQNQFAGEQRALYQDLYEPLHKQFAEEAQNWNSPEQKALARGQATSAVSNQFEAQRGAAERQLQGFGVDPGSARFGALDIGTRTAEGAAQAAAGTQSDINRDVTGMGLKATALNIGQNVASGANASAAGGVNAGAGAVNATTSNYAPYAPALANPVAFGGLSQGALGLAGSFTNNQYQNQAQQFAANQQSSSGIGSAIGSGLALGAMFLAKGGKVPSPMGHEQPPPEARQSITTPSRNMNFPRGLRRLSAVPLSMKFDDGGAVPMAGQEVPSSMSPSGGAVTDDIPAQVGQTAGGPAAPGPQARINAGEFVFDQPSTQFYGAKHLHGLMEKAHKAMGIGGAVGGAGAPGGRAGASGGASMGASTGMHRPGHIQAPQGHGGVRPAIPLQTGQHHPLAGKLPRAAMAAMRHAKYAGRYAGGGAVSVPPGQGGGAGRGPGVNWGGHQPTSRALPYPGGAGSGAVRSALTGV